MTERIDIMKKYIGTVLTALVVIGLSITALFVSDLSLDNVQLETLVILAFICGGSILYCFIVGELAHNNSQMDKLWSILPIAYTWVIAVKGGMDIRLVVYAVIVTLWGIRLTINFARKGAYRLKFWTGEEDYRWAVLRKTKILGNRFVWGVFDLFFICIYQNLIVLAICLPALACMGSTIPFGVFDYVASVSSMLFLILETIADEQQWRFHQKKKKFLREGKTLDDMPEPYSIGFNTTGLWGYFRHPNYLGEQAIWLCLYIFAIGAGVCKAAIFNWSMIGPLFLVLLFCGSSAFGEAISSSKYPLYTKYQQQVFKYLPIRKFNPDK